MGKKRNLDVLDKGSTSRQMTWAPTLILGVLWALGAGVYTWLVTGIYCQRDYTNLTCSMQDWFFSKKWSLWVGLDFFLPLVISFLVVVISLISILIRKRFRQAKENLNPGADTLRTTLVTVAPVLFIISAIAVLAAAFAANNDPWSDNIQGIITGFSALFASIGALATVAVTYKSGEENRATQKEIEGRKHDAELIKNLNERLHEIIPRRYGSESEEVSPSYFQLAALYKDWETLSANSSLIALQRESQQRNILKLLFGVYQETEKEEIATRSELDIRTLNSVIQDIFPGYQRNEDKPDDAQGGGCDSDSVAQESERISFDLSYLDLRGLDLSRRDLRGANLIGAHLEGKETSLESSCLDGAKLNHAHLKGVNLQNTYLRGAELDGANLVGANLVLANLTGVKLRKALLKDAWLWGACLRGADLSGANLAGSELLDSDLNEALMEDARFTHEEETLDNPVVRERIIDQLKLLRSFLEPEQLRVVKGFDKDLRIRITREWINYKREMKVKELMDNSESE